MPADHDHRFGHGKAEALVALAQVALIAVSAIGIAWRAVDRLINGAQTEAMGDGIAVSLLAIAFTFVLLWYQRGVIARTGSVAIKTDNVHYKSDLMLNGAVIVALVLDQALHVAGADALFGIAIALWLLWGAWRASSEAVNQLMDREWPEDERQQFLDAAGGISRAAGPSRSCARATAARFASSSSMSGSRPTGPCRKRMTGSTASRRSCSSDFPARKS